MAVPETPPSPEPTPRPPRKPTVAPGWRWFSRVSGTVALLLFLTPTFYVLKYYAVDRPREAARARLVSLAPPAPPPSLDGIAPPLAPGASGNAAVFYTQAIQSFADRQARRHGLRPPSPAEAAALFEGARRTDCRFFLTNKAGQPQFVFRDPDLQNHPISYQMPRSAHEPYRYLGAAEELAEAMAFVPLILRPGDAHSRTTVGQTIVRFGAALGRERATRTHLQVSEDIQRLGLRLLRPNGGPAFKTYVYALQAAEDVTQAKYQLLEPVDPDNIALQERVAQADPDPLWRREAVWALGATLSQPGAAFRRPLEMLTGKATLAQVATHDADPTVRAAASQTLTEVAQKGAVIRR